MLQVSLIRDTNTLGTLREMLVLIRLWGQTTPTVLPSITPSAGRIIKCFSKPRRRRRRERRQTKGFMSGTMAVHVRFESRYISLPSSAKQQREMTKYYIF